MDEYFKLFKPMLPKNYFIPFDCLNDAEAVKEKVPDGYIIQRKYNGVRFFIYNGRCYTRTKKEVRSEQMRADVERIIYGLNLKDDTFYEGEFLLRTGSVTRPLEDISGFVNSIKYKKDLTDTFREYVFFDVFSFRRISESSGRRVRTLRDIIGEGVDIKDGLRVRRAVSTDRYVYEDTDDGIILRRDAAAYQFGRATTELYKVKPFYTVDAEIIDIIERQVGIEESEVNRLGYRSKPKRIGSHRGAGSAGSFLVRTDKGVEFSCGLGLSAKSREDLWANKPIGKIIEVEYRHVSQYGIPQHPVFKGKFI